MAGTRSPSVRTLLRLAIGLTSLVAPSAATRGPLTHDPVTWYEDDRRHIERPEERDPNLIWDMIDDSIVLPVSRATRPDRLVRRVGTIFGGEHVRPAVNVNALEEVPNSSWFTNRIGLFPMTPAAAAQGPGDGAGPDTTAAWTVTSAKNEGVTPGFVIHDACGDAFLIKFDPPHSLGMTTRAGVISARILHAAGYNVPDDNVVVFDKGKLTLGHGVKIKLPDGSKRPMTGADLETILGKVEPLPDGRFLAIASRFVEGRPIGCYNFRGRRRDDPNDHIDHENRREQRGLRIFAAFLNHYDTKQHNSLDTYFAEGDTHFVRHYLIDFASTLGTGAAGAQPRYGWEHTIDLLPLFGRAFSLGLHEDSWRRVRRPPGLDEIGYWESKEFDPIDFKPLQPNTAFAHLTHRDGYWAAKIISAFTDDHLAAIVETARYRSRAAAAYMTRVLSERRDKIARTCFDRIPPLDFFRVAEGNVRFRDLGVERNIYPADATRYRVRVRPVRSDRRGPDWPVWQENRNTSAALPSAESAGPPLRDYPFWAIECQVNRGAGWSRTTRVYVSRVTQAVIALER